MCQSVRAFFVGACKRGITRSGNIVKAGGTELILLIAAGFFPAISAGDDEQPLTAAQVNEQITTGHELFVRQWKPDDERAVEGDGLGPVFNAASCAKCHRLGGLGGAGTNADNVDLLTIQAPRNVTSIDDELRRKVVAFHPGLAISRQQATAFSPAAVAVQLSATTVLHRFSSDPNYEAWRRRFLAGSRTIRLPLDRIVAFNTGKSLRPLGGMHPVQRLEGLAYQYSERNTPALFGAGLIDGLPDAVFEEMLVRQAETTDSYISGKIPRVAGGKAGRFGWRGQSENLHEFVLGACAVELGLEAPGRAQPIDPLRVSFDRPLAVDSLGLDISDEQCKSLTQFVAHLPPPRILKPTDTAQAAAVARGEERFEKIGCADCHFKQVADIAGIYSDLLLHDMGEGLADPVPANPGGSPSYYGGGDSLLVKTPPDQQREWRTPPLWGARDSGPYLHDGRAPTFPEAIAWHAGEAARSALAFRQLEKAEQEEVLAFLNCLAAPATESLALENVLLADGP